MKKRGVVFLLILVIVIAAVAISIYKSTNKTDAISMKVYGDKEMSRTIISPHMEQEMIEDTNILYCSSFQLCWNEMKHLVNGDIKLTNSPDIVAFLNKSLSTKDDLSEDAYVALAGMIKDNIENRINEELSSKIDDAEAVDFSRLLPDDIVAYAYMYKNLQFEEEFESLDEGLYFLEGESGVRVEAFGIKKYSDKNIEMGKQVDLIDYNNDEDFIISLKTKSQDEEIILAKIKPGETLLETIESVNKRILNGKKESLKRDDVLMIPKFSFKATNRYSELINKYLLNDEFTNYFIAEALQEIEFVLDEKGAMLKSKARIVAIKEASESRYLVFDQPFLLYMKQKDVAHPYFVLWIENTELMMDYIKK